MEIDGATWESCEPEWVTRFNACGPAIRRVVLTECGDLAMPGGYYAGHEHLMSQGAPVLWADALAGQLDRLAMEDGERAACDRESEEPF